MAEIIELFDHDAAVLDRISVYDELAPVIAEAALVFEAAPDRLPLKQEVFVELEGVVAAS
jgi:3-hydroxybutyryl-CoA dehydrogenase